MNLDTFGDKPQCLALGSQSRAVKACRSVSRAKYKYVKLRCLASECTFALDNLKEIQILDKGGVLSSIEDFPKQCQQAWEETRNLRLPKDYGQVENIVVVGMGGSGFAAEMVKFVLADKLRVPFEVIHDYDLPNYTGKKSLILLSSYSGTTHEVLNAARLAWQKNLKITGLCRGGGLAKFFQEYKLPSYIFQENFNQSGQPRLGSGYMVVGIAGLLKKYGLLDLTDGEVQRAINFVSGKQKAWRATVVTSENPLKHLALELKEKIPVIVTAEFLEASGRALRNQFNESAKNFSVYHPIPEMNHHLLEGLQFPKINRELLVFLFVRSLLYRAENQKRFQITQEVVEKNNVRHLEINLEGKTRLEQSFEFFSLGSFLSFYLSLLNGVDAQKIPWVDYFKRQLESS